MTDRGACRMATTYLVSAKLEDAVRLVMFAQFWGSQVRYQGLWPSLVLLYYPVASSPDVAPSVYSSATKERSGRTRGCADPDLLLKARWDTSAKWRRLEKTGTIRSANRISR